MTPASFCFKTYFPSTAHQPNEASLPRRKPVALADIVASAIFQRVDTRVYRLPKSPSFFCHLQHESRLAHKLSCSTHDILLVTSDGS